jgi:tetratricopeptide (TPR) repeat protein
VATGRLIDEDADEALAHAMAARRLASRIAAIREAVGLAAYRAGEWQTAIAELRTYHRMSGRQTHLAVIADAERALGRPERAVDLYRNADLEALGRADAVELLIVAAGARTDLGQRDAAVTMLQVRELTAAEGEPWVPRLRYAYADALLAAGRREEAREWFSRAAVADEDAETDAADRLLELDGVVLDDDEPEDVAETEEPEDVAETEEPEDVAQAEEPEDVAQAEEPEDVAQAEGDVETGADVEHFEDETDVEDDADVKAEADVGAETDVDNHAEDEDDAEHAEEEVKPADAAGPGLDDGEPDERA